jgi:hypothetical protein
MSFTRLVREAGFSKGDVNCSWAGPSSLVDLDVAESSYFDELASVLAVPPAVWGVLSL